MNTYKSIDEYISQFPMTTQRKLIEIRKIIHETAPDATEKISYAMPTFYLNGNLVHFAGYEHHIGFYPVPTALEKFKKDIEKYKHSKGGVQFPLDQELPIGLIKRIVKFRAEENLKKKN